MKKITKKSNKKDPRIEKEIKHYLGALAETYNENLKAIKEGSIITNRKLENIEKILDSHTETLELHTKILDSHTETLELHTKILDSHTETLELHTKILDSHTEMIGTLMEDVSILKNDMQIVKKEIKRKVDYDEFILLVERVNKLESKI